LPSIRPSSEVCSVRLTPPGLSLPLAKEQAAQQVSLGLGDIALFERAAAAGRPDAGQHGLFDLAERIVAQALGDGQLTLGKAREKLQFGKAV